MAELSDALDEDGTDLQAVLSVLDDDLTTAVPSYLGLTMTFPPYGPDGEWVTMDFLPADLADAVSTTLMVPLHAPGVPRAGGTVVFDRVQTGWATSSPSRISFPGIRSVEVAQCRTSAW